MAISRAFPLAVETIDRQMAGFVETADIPEGRQASRQAGVSTRRFRGNFVGYCLRENLRNVRFVFPSNP